MNKLLGALVLIYISFNANAEENTIEGFWASSGAIIEVKVCHELICAEIVHVITEDGIDHSTVLDVNNMEEGKKDDKFSLLFSISKNAILYINIFKSD